MCVCECACNIFGIFAYVKNIKENCLRKKRRCKVEKLETAKAENSLCLKFQQLIIRKNNNNNKKCRYILNFQRAAIKIVAHKQREAEGNWRGQANGRFINNSYECAYKKLKNRLSAKKD